MSVWWAIVLSSSPCEIEKKRARKNKISLNYGKIDILFYTYICFFFKKSNKLHRFRHLFDCFYFYFTLFFFFAARHIFGKTYLIFDREHTNELIMYLYSFFTRFRLQTYFLYCLLFYIFLRVEF